MFTAGQLASVARSHFNSVTRPNTNGSAVPTSSVIGGDLHYLNTIDAQLVYLAGLAKWGAIPVVSYLTNKSGGGVVAGDVIVIDTTTASSFTTIATAATAGIIGVALDTIASNASGPVQFFGMAYVNVTGATAIGDYLATSTTVKKAAPSASIPAATGNCFARALTTSSTQVLALLGGMTGSDFGSVATSVSKEFDPAQRFHFRDDFIGHGADSTGAGVWYGGIPYYTSGTGITYRATTDGFGIVEIPGGQNIYLWAGASTTSDKPFLATKTNFSFKTRWCLHVQAGGANWVALTSNETSITAAAVGFRITGATGNIFAFMVTASGTEVTLDTGVASALDTLHSMEAKRTGAAVVSIYIDGVLKGTLAGTIPTELLTFSAKSAGAGDTIDLDYWDVSFDM